MGVPQWRRLRLMIQGCPHDADREVMVKFIRSLLMANLTEFRRSKPL